MSLEINNNQLLNYFGKIPSNGCSSAGPFSRCFLWKDKAQVSEHWLTQEHMAQKWWWMPPIFMRKCLSPKSDAWKIPADFTELNSTALWFSGSSGHIPPLQASPLPATAAAASPVYLAPPGLTQSPSQWTDGYFHFLAGWNPLSPAQVWTPTFQLLFHRQVKPQAGIPSLSLWCSEERSTLVFPVHTKHNTHLINIHSYFYQDC